jgi:iron complex outermembrane receptor protein
MHVRSRACRAVGLLLALAGAAAALRAQDARPAAVLERVEVTGSRLPQLDGEAGAPVQVIRREQIERSGAQTAEELLQLSSAFIGRTTDAGIVGNTDNPGQSVAALRGLPVLVLLNGRRLIGYAFGDSGVDLHAIPTAAIERIEILKDGASAVYGSDAQGGVINFITRKDFRGGVVEVGGGGSQRGGASRTRSTLTAGTGDADRDGYNAFVVLDHLRKAPLAAADRAYAATGFRPQDGLDATSVNAFPANVPTARGFVNPAAPACTAITVAKGAACFHDLASATELLSGSENWSLVSRGMLSLARGTEGYAEFVFARHRIDEALFPMPVNAGTTLGGVPLVLPATSPFRPQGPGQGGDLVNLRYRTVPFGPTVRRTVADQGRLLVGLRGEAAGWDLDGAVGHTVSRGTQYYRSGYVDSRKLVDAFASGLVNPFGDSGPAGDALLAEAELRGEVRRARATAQSVDVRANRELMRRDAGPVYLALGAEARHETLDDAASALAALAVGAGNVVAIGAPSAGSRRSQAVYAELGVPLARTLETQVALRADRYSGGVGSTVNPNLTLRWHPVGELLLRASAGTGFVAPSLPQLYTARTLSAGVVLPYADPLRCPVTQAAADCRIETAIVSGGNPLLAPQRSKQTSIGAAFEPGRDALVALDLWRVRLKDALSTPNPQDILSGDPQYEGRNIVRGPADPATPGLPGAIVQLLAVPENIGRVAVSGIDLDLRWKSAPGPVGRFGIDLNGTYLLEAHYQGSELAIGRSNGNASLARWQHQLTLGWERQAWAVTLAQTYRRGHTDARPDAQGQVRRVSDYTVWDAQLARRDLPTPWGSARIAVGAKNVFDRDPPFSNQRSFVQVGYDPYYADPRGRYWYATLGLQWL